jgi:hypothetical protein
MAGYKRLKKAQTVLALCFADCGETYHHWRVFSHGSDGVCIEFWKESLLSAFPQDSHTRHREVDYRDILRLVPTEPPVPVEELPFLKQTDFADEREYRVVYIDENTRQETRDYPIELSMIESITLSPWMTLRQR